MTERKPRKRARRPKTTAVPDRSLSLTLGDEAQLVIDLLRMCGADPDLVPTDMIDDAARKQWQEERRSFAPLVPLFLMDWAAAILAAIPQRKITRPQGRPRGYDVIQVETCADICGGVAKAARYVAAMSFEQKWRGRKSWDEFFGDRDIKALIQRLAKLKNK